MSRAPIEITTPPPGCEDAERVARELWTAFRIPVRVRIDYSVRRLSVRYLHRGRRSR